MPQLAKASDKRGVVMWKSSRQSIRWIAGLTLLATILSGGLVACGAADDSGDDRLSRLDRRETREARAERDDRRTTEAESAGDRSERIGSLFQRLSSGGPTTPAEGPTRPGFRGFNGRDDHGNDIDGATGLSSARPARGDLEAEDDSDYFSFRAERGVRYVIEARLISNSDTVMDLLDSDGSQIEYDDDGGSGSGSRIEWTASDNDTYYVVVRGYGGSNTGTYELSLVDFRERLQSAVRISPGTRSESRLGENDADYYYFRADRGVYYAIEAHLLTHPDTVIRLLDSDGHEIASDDDGGADGGSRIEWEANEDGTYYIVVSAFDSDYIGSYRLTLER